MAYNHEVWREVRTRMLTEPKRTFPRALSPKEALARRMQYMWAFESEAETEDGRLFGLHDAYAEHTSMSRSQSHGSGFGHSAFGSTSRTGSQPGSRSASRASTRPNRADPYSLETVHEDGSRPGSQYSLGSKDPRSPSRLLQAIQSGRRSAMGSKQLMRAGSNLLESRPTTPTECGSRVEREPIDPQQLHDWARKHRIVLMEVEKYWDIFDELDLFAKRTMTRSKFEKLLYGCIACPKRVRLPKHRLAELWEKADTEKRDYIDFDEFLTFYKAHVKECVGSLVY
uniref:EF-hand domain-containing protein n=1 Tax=Alexandrium monilatum TaxID=311494 RepID=A0A7S4Q6E2_9DINO